MKFLIITLAFIFLVFGNTSANVFKVEGTIKGDVLAGRRVVLLEIYTDALKSTDNFFSSPSYLTSDSSGFFHFEKKDSDSLFYISVAYLLPNGRHISMLPDNQLLLVTNRTHLKILIQNNHIYFEGEDSALLEYQKQFFLIKLRSPRGMSNISFYSRRMEDLKNAVAMADSIKSQYTGKMNTDYINIIYDNWYYSRLLGILSSLAVSSNFDDSAHMEVVTNSINLFVPEISNRNLTSDNNFFSRFKCESLFYLESLKLAARHKTTFYNVPMKELLTNIRDKYFGLLRDQLLVTLFMKSISNMNGLNMEFLKSHVASNICSNHYREILSSVLDAKSPGSPAFPFNLSDINEKSFELGDFKGKAMVFEFWFYGCTPCKILSRDMKEVITHYKNKEIVFLSINVDENKENWLKGLKSGEYTSKETINLYTNGRGFLHPLLKYYNFVGAPELLIINKNGRLVSAKPPRPNTIQNKIELCKLIDDSLK